MKRLAAVDRLLFRIELTLGILCLLVIVVALALGIIFRFGLDEPLVWTTELSVLAQVWLTFLGASAVLKERGHVAISALVDLMPRTAGRMAEAAVAVVLAIVLLALAWTTIDLVQVQHGQRLSTLDLPRSVYSIPIVWAALSMTYSVLASLIVREDRDAPAGAQDSDQIA